MKNYIRLPCHKCKNTGRVDGEETFNFCYYCNGTGNFLHSCSACQGISKPSNNCLICGGTGLIEHMVFNALTVFKHLGFVSELSISNTSKGKNNHNYKGIIKFSAPVV